MMAFLQRKRERRELANQTSIQSKSVAVAQLRPISHVININKLLASEGVEHIKLRQFLSLSAIHKFNLRRTGVGWAWSYCDTCAKLRSQISLPGSNLRWIINGLSSVGIIPETETSEDRVIKMLEDALIDAYRVQYPAE